jgi:hypothetical protein
MVEAFSDLTASGVPYKNQFWKRILAPSLGSGRMRTGFESPIVNAK